MYEKLIEVIEQRKVKPLSKFETPKFVHLQEVEREFLEAFSFII